MGLKWGRRAESGAGVGVGMLVVGAGGGVWYRRSGRVLLSEWWMRHRPHRLHAPSPGLMTVGGMGSNS